MPRSASPFSVALSHDTAMAAGELPGLGPAASCLCRTTIVPAGGRREAHFGGRRISVFAHNLSPENVVLGGKSIT